jgi:probable phosphoglycerate mutase
MDGTRLVLVRHGESVAQVEEIIGGHRGCRGLSERGRGQGVALADRLRATGELGPVARVYTSLMPRAVETAALVCDALDHPDALQDCGFCEQHPADAFDGMTWREFERRYPPPGAAWTPDYRREPDDESWSDMAVRVQAALDALVERHAGETVVVVCHGGVIMQTIERWLGVEPVPADGSRGWLHAENTSITEWRFGRVPWRPERGGWQLVRFNDHAHLAQPAPR